MAARLNKRERIVILIGIIVLALVCLVPPWQSDPSHKGHWLSAGYWPVFLQPREWSWQAAGSDSEKAHILPGTDLGKIGLKPLTLWGVSYRGFEYAKFEVHNRTDRPLSEITIEVLVSPKSPPATRSVYDEVMEMARRPANSWGPMIYPVDHRFLTPVSPGAVLGGDARLPYDFRFDANSQEWSARVKAAEWSPSDRAVSEGKSVLVPVTNPLRIDSTRLLVQCVLVVFVASAILFMMRTRASQSGQT